MLRLSKAQWIASEVVKWACVLWMWVYVVAEGISRVSWRGLNNSGQTVWPGAHAATVKAILGGRFFLAPVVLLAIAIWVQQVSDPINPAAMTSDFESGTPSLVALCITQNSVRSVHLPFASESPDRSMSMSFTALTAARALQTAFIRLNRPARLLCDDTYPV